MSDSIREQIIQAVIARLAVITTANGFNTGIGATVERARKMLDPDDLPACVVWPKSEAPAREYGKGMLAMPIQIDGMALYGSVNMSVVAEQMLADIIEAMQGIVWSLAYTSGGTTEIEAGNAISGHTSTATALVQTVTLDSGTWAGGDAAGTLTLRQVSGTFQAENLDVGSTENAASIAGAPTGTDPVNTVTGDLADSIAYAGGGVDEYPDAGDQAVGVQTQWILRYRIAAGDPYHQ